MHFNVQIPQTQMLILFILICGFKGIVEDDNCTHCGKERMIS